MYCWEPGAAPCRGFITEASCKDHTSRTPPVPSSISSGVPLSVNLKCPCVQVTNMVDDPGALETQC